MGGRWTREGAVSADEGRDERGQGGGEGGRKGEISPPRSFLKVDAYDDDDIDNDTMILSTGIWTS